MKTSVLVTGVSGTGKTTICRIFQELGYRALDIEDINGLYELIDTQTGAIIPGDRDKIREGLDWNCNKHKLQELIEAELGGLTFYCGGMANTEEVWGAFDAIVVLTVSDVTTMQRLMTRQQGEFGNTSEEREWVLSWKHDIEQRWLKLGGVNVSAESNPNDVARRVVELYDNSSTLQGGVDNAC